MEFNKGMYFKIKKTGRIYRIDVPINVFTKPAWICCNIPNGNCFEGRSLFFEENLNMLIQNNDIEIIEKR